MKLLTLEWIQKAEEDYLSAQREYRARKSPNLPPHFLPMPWSSATQVKMLVNEEAKDGLKICREFRRAARQSLGLPE